MQRRDGLLWGFFLLAASSSSPLGSEPAPWPRPWERGMSGTGYWYRRKAQVVGGRRIGEDLGVGGVGMLEQELEQESELQQELEKEQEVNVDVEGLGL